MTYSAKADEIEREIHKRFQEQVYVGMSTSDYHAALAHVIVRVTAEHLASMPNQQSTPT